MQGQGSHSDFAWESFGRFLWFFKFLPKDMFIDFLDILERERERERDAERERNIDQLPPVHTPTRDATCNLGMHPDRGSNPQLLVYEGDALTD